VTAPEVEFKHPRAVLVLTVATVVLWLVALFAASAALVLLLRVEAPAGRTVAIVAGWFLTPAIPAIAATVGMVVARQSARRRGAAPDADTEMRSSSVW
jgi:hypothetical protein